MLNLGAGVVSYYHYCAKLEGAPVLAIGMLAKSVAYRITCFVV